MLLAVFIHYHKVYEYDIVVAEITELIIGIFLPKRISFLVMQRAASVSLYSGLQKRLLVSLYSAN